MARSQAYAHAEHDPYVRAIAYASERGTADGQNAAGWYTQGSLANRIGARAILAGIEDGDPAVLDTFPYADLSCEWADTLTGPQLVEDALYEAYGRHVTDRMRDSAQYQERSEVWFTGICDAYEAAFSTAVEDAIATAARAVLGIGVPVSVEITPRGQRIIDRQVAES